MGNHIKTCDRCRRTDDKYRNKHEEQIKVNRDQYYLDDQDKTKECREVNKDANVVVLQEEIKFPNLQNHHGSSI